MKNYYTDQPNGYLESIQKGLAAVRSYDLRVSRGIGSRDEQIARLKKELETADAVVVGAGAGLSTAAGFTYAGDRFKRYFSDFEKRFGFHDMYTGGFVVMNAEPEVMWAYWARHIYFNRYVSAPKPVYQNLLSLLAGKDYFVITTNVDHQFQRAGFDKKRLFYTQGDYGLFQSIDPKVQKTLFSYANSIGAPTVREIFGAGIALNEWVEPIMQYDIIPHITLKPNRYKNSSDISLVLGAADVLINNIKQPETACDTVIIVSSDCDFSPLATRLRREGLRVIGIVTAHCEKMCRQY